MEQSFPYEVQIEHLTAQPIAVTRTRTRYDALSEVVPRLCGEAWEGVKAHPEVQIPDALMLAVYYPLPSDDASAKDELDLEVGVQIAGSFKGGGTVSYSTTPAGRAAHTTHQGTFQDLGNAHSAVKEYCRQNGYTISGVRWEVYGHQRPNDSGVQVDVFYVIE